jgi:outer membrane protein TolC
LASTLDPAVVYTDPRIGEEAALSAFDANLFASSIYENNHRGYNNNFFGVNGLFLQDLSTTQYGISKRSATGGLYTLRDVKIFDRNNQQSNRFAYSWDTFLEAQVRQPLMLGAGSEFNRIAGPGATPGQLNGVLLARVRTDISLVEFERSVRDFVAEIENAYWDLYFAYRDLDTKTEARDQAIDTVKKFEERSGRGSVDAQQALEQLWRFEADVVDSLNGRPLDGTRSNNGSTGGTFRNSGGVRISERRLRLIIGMPINDQRLVYPSDQPSLAQLDFDWEDSISDALVNREELRRQRWVIKQRELELIGNRSFLKPQLDAIAAYRMRGFGKQFNTPLDNDFQEWSLGLDYLMPVGYRRGHAAVRNTQLALARESQILIEQERAVHFGLSNAINEAKRAYENLLIQRNRYEAVEKQIKAFETRLNSGRAEQFFVLLEAQRRRLDALVRYHQSAVEYQLAVRNVNLERGTLLSYCNVYLNESPSSDFIASQGIERQERQDASASVHYRDPVIAAPASGPITSAIDAVR